MNCETRHLCFFPSCSDRDVDLDMDNYYNGYLFNSNRTASATGTQPPTSTQSVMQNPVFMSYPPFYQPNYFQYVSESERAPSPSPSSSGSSSSISVNKRSNWTSLECKGVIEAYRNSHELLRSTKSSHGKRKVWETIFSDFQKICTDADIASDKNQAQVKEKWRSLLEKYKSVHDHNNRTGRDRKTFDFYDDIDEFMSESDSVNLRYVQQTKLAQNETNTRPDNPPEEEDYSTDKTDLDDSPNDSEKKEKRKLGDKAEKKAPKKTRRHSDPSDTETAIVKLLEAQQAAMQRAEEKDEKVFQALLKSQSDAQSRHQEFVVSVLGKLGDIFSSNK